MGKKIEKFQEVYYSNIEQVAICLRWVDNHLETHEEYLGLYTVGNADSATLFLLFLMCFYGLTFLGKVYVVSAMMGLV